MLLNLSLSLLLDLLAQAQDDVLCLNAGVGLVKHHARQGPEQLALLQIKHQSTKQGLFFR